MMNHCRKGKDKKKWKAPARRLVWTDEETDAVFTGLAHLIRKRKLPGKTECVTLMRDYPLRIFINPPLTIVRIGEISYANKNGKKGSQEKISTTADKAVFVHKRL